MMGISATGQGSGDAADEAVAEGASASPVSAALAPELLPQHLVVEQVRVLDYDGGLKVVYPSRADLNSEAFETVRTQ